VFAPVRVPLVDGSLNPFVYRRRVLLVDAVPAIRKHQMFTLHMNKQRSTHTELSKRIGNTHTID
jgi:hypothetical protein